MISGWQIAPTGACEPAKHCVKALSNNSLDVVMFSASDYGSGVERLMQGVIMSDPGALTAADIARLAGVTRATVSNWRRRHADFPVPSGGTDASPAYDRNEVEAWLAERGALPELPMHERLWRHVQDAANGAELGEIVAWAARELAAVRGAVVEVQQPRPSVPGITLTEDTGDRSGKLAALSRELADAALKCDPADVLDSLITRYAEASGGRVSLTARPVADLMAAIAAPRGGTVLDPACGTGELLAAASRLGATRLFGQELDTSLAELTSIRLSISAGRDGGVSAGDSLRNDKFPDLAADAVMCHPPFGDRDWGQEELVLDPRWEYGTPPKAEPELAWAQHALAHLRPGGRAVLVMPPAAAGRASGRRIRAEMLRRGAIKAVIALEPGAIYPRHVGPHLWVLERPRDAALEPRVLLVDSGQQDTILAAWRSFSARVGSAAGPEQGAWRSVPAIDLLDESVDLTPSRHVGIRATESSPAEAAKAVDASRAKLLVALEAMSRALPGADWARPDRGLGWREISIGELANSGTLQVHRKSSGSSETEAVRIGRGDVLLPVTAAGPVNVRVATEADVGDVLGQGLYLIRPDPERVDPWFLAGFLGSPASLQQAKYGTSSMRIDARRLTVPLLPLPEQQRYAAAFRRLHEFSTVAIELAGRARALGELLGESLTRGVLIPDNDEEKLLMQTFCGRFASIQRHHDQTGLKEGARERG
jgi:SAM-dependent methyltransferase